MIEQPKKWAAYFEGDERVSLSDTEGEAIGEMEYQIDADFEPGEQVEYRLAQMVNGLELLQRQRAQRIGEDIIEQIENDLTDEMGSEESPLSFAPDDAQRLGEMVVAFIVANARRLVACWNACESISTERLEDLGRPLLAHLIGCDERAARQVKECDELLAALEVMLRDYTAVHDIGDVEMQPAIYQARAAIAKVKGGEA